jgi:predicted GNAT family N-acyltransferase
MEPVVIMTDFRTSQAAIREVRDEVFVMEQNVERVEEYDDRDLICTHVVVFDGQIAVATARIDLEKGGKIGRVAVRKNYRQRGLGTLVMQRLEEFAIQMSTPRLWFHAQTQAVSFYEKLGYRVCSDEFLEANIPHVQMEKDFQS